MWILHSISFLWCTSYGNCAGENKSSTFIWLNLTHARLNTKQCWPAISINYMYHIWDRSLGFCSWLDLVILQYFCWGQSLLSSCLLMQLFLSAKLSLEVLSVEMPSGCRSHGYHGYIHCLLMAPLIPKTHRLTMCLTVRLNNRVGSSITLLTTLKTFISFSYTLVKNEGELHWVQQHEQIPDTLPFQVALSCLSFSPGFDHLWLLMGGFQPNQEPAIRKEFEGKLFEPSFLEECTKPTKCLPNLCHIWSSEK